MPDLMQLILRDLPGYVYDPNMQVGHCDHISFLLFNKNKFKIKDKNNDNITNSILTY